MVHIRLERVRVDFPIYNSTNRSLKNKLLRMGTSDRLRTDGRNRKVVKALNNISLEVHEGDRIGLVGPNGAGKTTLLRVMAGVYEPTSGTRSSLGNIVPLFGGSLGMDPELPGFDNIELRGRILGLSSKQIKQKTEEIADFTELEEFLHLPVRTYSAGMRVRLAFGITTSVDADILLLDEGIGAGDIAFREKANERLNQFIERAGILVVASHSASLMTRFCDQALWLEQGEAKARGPIDQIQARYHEAASITPTRRFDPELAAQAAAVKRDAYEQMMASKKVAFENAAAAKQAAYERMAAAKVEAYERMLASRQEMYERAAAEKRDALRAKRAQEQQEQASLAKPDES